MSRKLSIDKVKEEFNRAGLELLTEDYYGVDVPLSFRCKKGHQHQISLTALRRGSRCTFCAGNKRLGLDFIREEFSKVGYTLLEKEYKNNKQLLLFRCDKGHEHKISYGKFKAGRRCPFCFTIKKKRKYQDLDDVYKEFLDVGYIPLFKEYKGVNHLLSFRCDKGHEHSIRLKDLRRGSRCALCVGGVRDHFHNVKKEFYKVGYKLLETTYKNNREPLLYQCDKGHQHKMSLTNLKAGNQCPTCSQEQAGERLMLSIDEVRERFFSIGYTPLFDEYKGSFSKVPFKCDKGHYHEIMPYTLQNGVRCRKCSYAGISRTEKEIADYFKDLGVSFQENYRKLIGPKEVDLYFPREKIAVEYCGLYWHSELSGGKPRNYHYKKMMQCREKNVRLITIFEDEYLERPKVVLSRIENALGITKHKVFARKCSVEIISSSDAESFLEANHLQGPSLMKVAFGLFYQEELIGVMTGGSLSRNCRSKKDTLELKRLCFKPGYKVVGGSSKLFKQLVEYAKGLDFKFIRSYQDMRYGDPFNPVYKKLGFEFISESKYTPHYVEGGHRYRNQRFMKTSEERKTGKTEWELRKEQGFDRIWDCGHRTYVYDLNTITY